MHYMVVVKILALIEKYAGCSESIQKILTNRKNMFVPLI